MKITNEALLYLIKVKILNVWFKQYLKAKKLDCVMNPLSHYIKLVEDWETVSRHAKFFGIPGGFGLLLLAAVLCWGLIPSLGGGGFGSLGWVLIGILAVGTTLLFVFGAIAFVQAKQLKPNRTQRRLVFRYRKVLAAVDTTRLWDDYVFGPRSEDFESHLAQLGDLIGPTADQMPEFLSQAALLRLDLIGKRVSDLQGGQISNQLQKEALEIRNGLLTACYDDAVLLGFVKEGTGVGTFISPSELVT